MVMYSSILDTVVFCTCVLLNYKKKVTFYKLE